MHRVEKPWGYELIFADTDKYVGKILHVDEGEQLSLQYHEIKDETIYVSSGTSSITPTGTTSATSQRTVPPRDRGRWDTPRKARPLPLR